MVVRATKFDLDPNAALHNGLLAAFLGNRPGSTTCYDSSTGGWDGTLVNMDAATDWVLDATLNRYVLDFDNIDDSVSLPGPTLSTSAPFSVGIWAYISAWPSADSYPEAIKFASDSEPVIIGLANASPSNYLGILIGSQTTWARLHTNTPSATFLGSWNHLLRTYNGGGAGTAGNHAIYLNGSLVSSVAAGAFGAATNEGRIGWESPNVSSIFRWKGLLGDAVVYNRVLSQAEISALADPTNVLLRVGTGPSLIRATGVVRRTVQQPIRPSIREAV